MKGEADTKHTMKKRNPNQKGRTQKSPADIAFLVPPCLRRGRGCANPEAVGNDGLTGGRPGRDLGKWAPRLEILVSRNMVRTSWKGEMS